MTRGREDREDSETERERKKSACVWGAIKVERLVPRTLE
jgi:hypothetical protein